MTVYPDESKKPPSGKGLNVPAQITLENIRAPPDFEGDEYIEELKATPNTDFVSYNLEMTEWVFNVEHFSSYSSVCDDTEEWGHYGSSSSTSSKSSSPIISCHSASGNHQTISNSIVRFIECQFPLGTLLPQWNESESPL